MEKTFIRSAVRWEFDPKCQPYIMSLLCTVFSKNSNNKNKKESVQVKLTLWVADVKMGEHGRSYCFPLQHVCKYGKPLRRWMLAFCTASWRASFYNNPLKEGGKNWISLLLSSYIVFSPKEESWYPLYQAYQALCCCGSTSASDKIFPPLSIYSPLCSVMLHKKNASIDILLNVSTFLR